MAITKPADAVVHSMHGSTFTSFVAPSLGSEQLCGWRLDVPGGTTGVEHRITHEEVVLVLSGRLTAWLDDEPCTAATGDVLRVPGGARFRVDSGPDGVQAWVVTSVGLEAVTADGQRIRPPWTR